MAKYLVEYTQVVHQTWIDTYEADSKEQAEELIMKDIDQGWDATEDNVVNGFFNIMEIGDSRVVRVNENGERFLGDD